VVDRCDRADEVEAAFAEVVSEEVGFDQLYGFTRVVPGSIDRPRIDSGRHHGAQALEYRTVGGGHS
jgi:hypothetical protein